MKKAVFTLSLAFVSFICLHSSICQPALANKAPIPPKNIIKTGASATMSEGTPTTDTSTPGAETSGQAGDPAQTGGNSGGGQMGTESGAGKEDAQAGGAGGGAPPENSEGTVRVNNLANLEALLNIIANGVEILGLAMGPPIFVAGIVLLCLKGKRIWGIFAIGFGCTCVIVGLATPGVINWLVASARDANLFN